MHLMWNLVLVKKLMFQLSGISLQAQFKGKGKGNYDQGVKAIADWLKRKGGDPEDAKWVFYLILKNGVNPQPFMYPGFKAGRKQLKQDAIKLC